MRTCFALLCLAVSACALPQTVPDALKPEYVPLGEVRLHDRSCSFDAVRVRNVHTNLSQRTDGSWGGVLLDRAVDVSVTEDTVRGVDVLLSRKESTEGHLVITGQFRGGIYRFELTDDLALIRTPTNSVTLHGRVIGEKEVSWGKGAVLRVFGKAGDENPPWPQIAFAMLATFN